MRLFALYGNVYKKLNDMREISESYCYGLV